MAGSALNELLARPIHIFDMDGVLVDSSPAHAEAFTRAFKSAGIAFPEYSQFAGRSTKDVVTDVLQRNDKEFNASDVDELVRNKQELAMNLIGQGQGVEQIPDAITYLKLLNESGKHLALVTSAARKRAEAILSLLSVDGLFSVVVTDDDVSAGKPSPVPYQTAISRMNCPSPNQCLVYEDSNSGVISALGAGAKVLQYRPAGAPDYSADMAFSSFADLCVVFQKLEIA